MVKEGQDRNHLERCKDKSKTGDSKPCGLCLPSVPFQSENPLDKGQANPLDKGYLKMLPHDSVCQPPDSVSATRKHSTFASTFAGVSCLDRRAGFWAFIFAFFSFLFFLLGWECFPFSSYSCPFFLIDLLSLCEPQFPPPENNIITLGKIK